MVQETTILCQMLCTSPNLPPQPYEIKETDPCGVMPIKTFAVLCFLDLTMSEPVSLSEVGLSMKTSKQSMITAHFHKAF